MICFLTKLKVFNVWQTQETPKTRYTGLIHEFIKFDFFYQSCSLQHHQILVTDM